MKYLLTILLMLTINAQAVTDVVLGKYSELRWVGSGTNYWSVWVSTGGTPAWQIPQFASTVGYFTFDEETNTLGQVVDRSFVGTNVGINYGMTWDPSHYGISASYTNTDATNYISLGDLDDWSFFSGTNEIDFSISFWSRTFALSGREYSLYKTNEWSVGMVSGTSFELYRYGYNGVTRISYTAAIMSGYEWAHWVFVCPKNSTKTGITIYMNGISRAVLGAGTGNTFMTNTASGFTIGKSADSAAGFIDDIIIYKNKLLTAEETLDITTNTWQYHGWSNSLYYVNRPLWSNCSCECTFVYDVCTDTAKSVLWTINRGGASSPVWKQESGVGYFDPDGTSDLQRSEVSAIPSVSTNYAMSCDFRATKTNLARQVLVTCNSGNTNNSISIELQLDKLVYSTFVQGFTNVVGTTVVTTNVWHHAAISCADSTGSLYYDHTLEASGPVGLATNLVQMDIFQMASSGSKWSFADERNIRFFTNALSQADIDSL